MRSMRKVSLRDVFSFSTFQSALLAASLVGLIVPLVLPGSSILAAGTLSFNALITTYTNSSFNFPQFAGVGDFNGDHKLDALVTDGSTSLRLMLGNGDGTFTEYDVSAAATNPGPIKAVDLNGDGKLDAVFVSNQGNLAATVLINTGNDGNGVPQFTVTNYASGLFAGLRSVTVGDLNGDGHPDFVVGNAFGNLRVFLNNGAGTFTGGQYTNMLPGAGGPSVGPSVIADLNGDGKADYIVASNQNHATNVFFGNGDGTLQTPAVIPSFGLFLAVADLNNDGRPDFVEVDPGSNDPSSGKLMVYLNNGDGTFSGPTLYPTGFSGPWSVTTADLDGDGNLDVAISDFEGNASGHQVAILLGDGHGAFGVPNLYAVNHGPLDVAVGDFNGDGKPDIATVGRQDRTYGVLLNNTVAADTTAPVVTVPSNTTLEATGPNGAVATFVATASDPDDANVIPACNPASGSTFSLGTTKVTCTAKDAAGNTGSASFNVTVQDTTPPNVNVPAGIVSEATGPAGAVETFTAFAVDTVSGNLIPTCIPASGSTFALGTTKVTCTAKDAAGNTGSASFNVTVQDTTPPVITSVTPGQTSLWPPNKAMIPISVAVSASDAVTSSSACKIVSVTSNEPDSGEWQITGALTLTLQADRLGTGTGRVYTISVTCADAAGNVSRPLTAAVTVPHDQGKK